MLPVKPSNFHPNSTSFFTFSSAGAKGKVLGGYLTIETPNSDAHYARNVFLLVCSREIE